MDGGIPGFRPEDRGRCPHPGRRLLVLVRGRLPRFLQPQRVQITHLHHAGPCALGHGAGRAIHNLAPALARLGFAAGAPVCLAVSCVALPWYASYRNPLACEAAWALVDESIADGATRLACYPRPCHAASLRLGRTDIPSFRSKEFDNFRAELMSRPRTIVLCTHRHSLQGLKQLLPAQCRVVREAPCTLPDIPWLPSAWQDKVRTLLGTTALGLCDAAVIEYIP